MTGRVPCSCGPFHGKTRILFSARQTFAYDKACPSVVPRNSHPADDAPLHAEKRLKKTKTTIVAATDAFLSNTD